MTRLEKILTRVLSGRADANIAFEDLRWVLLELDFSERIRGDHHIFFRQDVTEILNLQPSGSQAKPYQANRLET